MVNSTTFRALLLLEPFFNKHGPLLDDITNYTDKRDSVGMTVFHLMLQDEGARESKRA